MEIQKNEQYFGSTVSSSPRSSFGSHIDMQCLAISPASPPPTTETCLAGPVVEHERLDGGLVVDLDLVRHGADDLLHLRDGLPEAQGDAGPTDAALVVAEPTVDDIGWTVLHAPIVKRSGSGKKGTCVQHQMHCNHSTIIAANPHQSTPTKGSWRTEYRC